LLARHGRHGKPCAVRHGVEPVVALRVVQEQRALATWIEITGTEGSLFLDDTQRYNWLNTVADGTRFPMSTMPGEQVDHVFAGQMGPETIHFLEACIMDRQVMVTPESARMVMET